MTPAASEFSRRGFVTALLALGVAKALPLPMGLADIALLPANDWPLTVQYTLTFLVEADTDKWVIMKDALVPNDVARAA